MNPWTDTAVTYSTDWEPWNWVATIALVIVCVAASGAAVLIFERSFVLELSQRWYVLVGSGAVGVAGVVGLLTLPGTLMRHVKHHENVWWIVAPFVLLALGLVAAAFWKSLTAPFVPAGALALGTIVGAIGDALQRAAAWFPTSIAGLVIGTVVIVFAGVAWLRERS